MKKRILFAALFVLLLVSCTREEYLLCSDNVTQVLDISNCPEERPKCPESCDDNDPCTIDRCSSATDYLCVNEEIFPCSGNGICEIGEYGISSDCPDCDDNDECTEDSFNFDIGRCISKPIVPCCGNDICDTGETYVNCEADCPQLLDISVTRYEKTTRFAPAYIEDLTSTDYIYLKVYFRIRNEGIDGLEELNYKKQRGFYYDPFKMRLEDENGKMYDPEYDSDLLDGWLDSTIFPQGDSKPAALLFIVPTDVEHMRLVAYDRYGAKLDISEVY